MSSFGKYLPITGLIASGTLTQYKPVKFASTAGRAVNVNATTDRAIGVLQNDPTDGQPCDIAGLGECIARAAVNDLAAGDLLGYNSSGVADHTTDGRFIFATALQPSTGVGDEVKIFLTGLNSYGG